MTNNKFLVAKQGEQLVFNLLPNAKWANSEKESGKRYDILWKDIEIDVKTASESRKTSKGYSFSIGYQGFPIIVLVGLDGEKNHYWVKEINKSSYYAKLEEEVNPLELPKVIEECWNKRINSPMDKYMLASALGVYVTKIDEFINKGMPNKIINKKMSFILKEVLTWMEERVNHDNN